MKIVDKREDFASQLESAKREGKKSFGDDTVLLEKYVTKPRRKLSQRPRDICDKLTTVPFLRQTSRSRFSRTRTATTSPSSSTSNLSPVFPMSAAEADAVTRFSTTDETVLSSDATRRLSKKLPRRTFRKRSGTSFTKRLAKLQRRSGTVAQVQSVSRVHFVVISD